jgi:hypothetical protein
VLYKKQRKNKELYVRKTERDIQSGKKRDGVGKSEREREIEWWRERREC